MEIKIFGKDHWSTFAYVETCCVDNMGRLDIRRLRINEAKRPIRSNGLGWNPKYGTRIKDGSIYYLLQLASFLNGNGLPWSL